MNYRLEFGAWLPYVDADTDGNVSKKIFASEIEYQCVYAVLAVKFIGDLG